MTGPLTNVIHDLSSAEQHVALVWIGDHHPDVLAAAARYVRRMRALDTSAVRKENRP
jgi:hypothetical protein